MIPKQNSINGNDNNNNNMLCFINCRIATIIKGK